MSSLKNKNIIITGASGGIGNSIVEKLYDNGANIVATGTRLEKLEELNKNLIISKYLSLIFHNMKKLMSL